MVCEGLEIVDSGIKGILTYPISCDYYFYLKIMAALFVVLTMILFNRDKDKFLKADMISSMGVSAIVTIFIALLGTFLDMIQPDIFIEIFVAGIIFIVIWLLQ